jgi:DNA-binding transcriptional LysR family regulator
MLSWDDFRIVRAIAERRSLTGAAEALTVNHSTVFRRLGQIEERLGTALFVRGRAGYDPTPCGEEMVRLAERMAEDIVSFERTVTGRDLRPSGELRVTTNDTMVGYLLSDVFAAFRRAYPDIVLDVIVSNQSLNLSKRDADIAIRATAEPPETLIGRRIATIGWGIYGPVELAGRPFDPLIDGRRFTWVGFGDNLAHIRAARWLAETVGEERIVYRINTVLGLGEAAAAGIGLALMPCFIGATLPGLVRLDAAMPDFGAALWLLTHPDLRQTARVRAFMDFAAAELGRRKGVLEGTAPKANAPDMSRGAAKA